MLYKWVNYGRGWRPRWFALSDDVLSYYKIHGPDRIDLSRDTDRGAKVIGEDSLRRLARPSSASAPTPTATATTRRPVSPSVKSTSRSVARSMLRFAPLIRRSISLCF